MDVSIYCFAPLYPFLVRLKVLLVLLFPLCPALGLVLFFFGLPKRFLPMKFFQPFLFLLLRERTGQALGGKSYLARLVLIGSHNLYLILSECKAKNPYLGRAIAKCARDRGMILKRSL